jgi:hypothetical protein
MVFSSPGALFPLSGGTLTIQFFRGNLKEGTVSGPDPDKPRKRAFFEAISGSNRPDSVLFREVQKSSCIHVRTCGIIDIGHQRGARKLRKIAPLYSRDLRIPSNNFAFPFVLIGGRRRWTRKTSF